MSVTNPLHDGDHIKFVAAADLATGTWVKKAGLFGYIEGLAGVLAGETASARIKGVVVAAAPSTLVLADGAQVLVDLEDNEVVATGGDGVAGLCVGGKTNGQTTVTILLNEAAGVVPE